MRLRSFRRGSSLIEFACAIAILTPVLVGGIQFAAAYTIVEEVQGAVIRGARSAAVLPYDASGEVPTAAFRRSVEDAVMESSVTGLRREHIRITMHFRSGRPDEAEVSISGFGIAVPGGELTLDGKPAARFPYRGHWSASTE